jgi:hypothetical protein
MRNSPAVPFQQVLPPTPTPDLDTQDSWLRAIGRKLLAGGRCPACGGSRQTPQFYNTEPGGRKALVAERTHSAWVSRGLNLRQRRPEMVRLVSYSPGAVTAPDLTGRCGGPRPCGARRRTSARAPLRGVWGETPHGCAGVEAHGHAPLPARAAVRPQGTPCASGTRLGRSSPHQLCRSFYLLPS